MRHSRLINMDHGDLEQFCQNDGNQDSTEKITAFSKKDKSKTKQE